MPECCTGISRGHDVPIIGAAVVRTELLQLGKEKGPQILVRGKIFKKGTSDWLGLILGARALDCVDRGGLGFRPVAGAHYLERLGLAMPRTEQIGFGEQYRDLAYRMDVWCPPQEPAAVQQVCASIFDSDPSMATCGRCAGQSSDHGPWLGADRRSFCGSCTRNLSLSLGTCSTEPLRGDATLGSSLVSLSPDPVTLQPGDGAYIPVAVAGDSLEKLGPEVQRRGAGFH